MNTVNQHEPEKEAQSPWSNYIDKQAVRISPSASPVQGTITMPGSKSLTNRALIMAALAVGTSRLEGILKSDDSYWCIHNLTQLGIKIQVDREIAIVEGNRGEWTLQGIELYVGAAGTIARFLPGALAIGRGVWHLKGSNRMHERPLAPLLDALTSLGAVIQYDANSGFLPLTLHANGLMGGLVSLAGSVSSQFISGLLLAAPYAEEAITIKMEGSIVQPDYVELTLEMMRAFGVPSSWSDNGSSILIRPQKYKAQNIKLEPDVSTCGYFWALAALTNGRIRVDGIHSKTRQPDIELLNVLEVMGCTINLGENYIEVCGTSNLKGGFTLNMQRWSDQALTLAVLAIFADGPITLLGIEHIRHHECDRIAAICNELRKLSIQVDEHMDGFTVYPGLPKAAQLNPHDDHRMAMALALIGSKVAGISTLNPSCVSKTCSDYWDRLSTLGVVIELI
ncbi:3-phosphoshikimate 1-carboxyvinyltransferase [Paenibacillus psychroresistens]|uniref:3-phosphoshikimate 1-carboxyvinyltransferase n=1 Tax=Paenibacillus psychroresistens TaxID=1778678 RepID=A0A6B8RKY3_9BACL|nr:3-phosphoshikimate 1-carboxyvinyltransferase [Paenibacillus psychroresistens]QGQ96205.1 3-phosphoshikimate 1-carboxyvinyltransferase [Paenibacillus psychroresistens]